MSDLPTFANASTGPYHSCNCVGPRNGQPLCPCMMRSVSVENGRYVQTIDHGPVKGGHLDDFQKQMSKIFGEV